LKQIREEIVYHGEKISLTDGMTFDENGILYYGSLTMCAVHSWDPSNGNLTSSNQILLAQNDTTMMWPDTFGFDNQGSIIFTTGKFTQFPAYKGMDFTGASGPNFLILSVDIGANSYLDFPLPSPPSPDVPVSPPGPTPDGDDGPSTLEIVGLSLVVIVTIFAVVGLAVGIFVVLRKRQKREEVEFI